MAASFDHTDLTRLRQVTVDDLGVLPSAEDDRYEFKGSQTPDIELGKKLERAASAFWNSGGGFFVAGVDGAGAADGGLAASVGRQARRDWADQAIHRVDPTGPYEVRFIEGGSPSRGSIAADRGVLVVGFGESTAAPHMASDNRYYIRAGAHSLPAPRFVVEAIRARRGLSAPMLTFFVRPKEGASYFSEIEVVNLSPVPALDLEVTIIPEPSLMMRTGTQGKVLIRALDAAHPARIPFTHVTQGPNDWANVDQNHRITFRYQDPLGRKYETEATFLPRWDLPKPLGDRPALEQMSVTLQHIANHLQILKSMKR